MTVQRFDFVSQKFKRDPFPTLARMREAGPLVRTKMPLIGKIWLATSYEAVNDLLRDHERFVQEPRNAGRRNLAGYQWWMPSMMRALANNMLLRDEPDHRRLRGLVEQAFLRHTVEQMRGRIGAIADQLLDELERRAAVNGDRGVDLIEHFARPFPLAVICELLGLPDADRPDFARWANRLTNTRFAINLLTALPGLRRLNKYLKQQFQECRRRPREGLISALVAAEQAGDRLNEEELVAMAFLLLFAGHETTVHLLSGGVYTLLMHEEQKAELTSDWSKVGTAVEEILRYVSPVQFTKVRMASRNMEFHGRALERGDALVALLAAANCDPAQFNLPEKFDINRHPNPHVEFGAGIHICLGLKLARAEAAIALEKLFTRYPNLELAVSDAELCWTGRLGLRALRALPVRLHSKLASTSALDPQSAAVS